jgi:GTP-binding protein
MQFYDRAKIFVQAGAGGNGSAHLRREKYVPYGGPDGGDGGRGGSIYLLTDPGLNTLVEYHYRQHHRAGNGGNGFKQRSHGAKGDDITLRVPPGTVVRDAETSELLADMTDPDQRVMIARGGRGGLGNVHFATSTNQTPREAQKGEPGEERWVTMELKLIADVGLVGFPNAGKSTLLSVVSAARPKIADYPFTTLTPNLGVVTIGAPGSGDDFSFVLADIPGLIEGAAEGAGLGHEFLRHVERTRLLLHLIDGASLEHDPWQGLEIINRELAQYSPDLASRPQIIVFNKMDLPEAQQRWPHMQQRAEQASFPIFSISAAARQGVDDLLYFTANRLRELQAEARAVAQRNPLPAGPILRPEPEDAFYISRDEQGVFIVRGKRVERMVAMTDQESHEGMARLEHHLRRMGVTEALEQAGIQPGDPVRFGKVELLWGE